MAQNKLFCARKMPGAPFVRASINPKKALKFEQVKVGKVILMMKDGYPQMMLTAPKRKGDYKARCPLGTKAVHIDSSHELEGFGRRRSRRR